MRTVRTEQELGQAIRHDEDRIEIEGDLAKKVIRLKATGKVAWAVAIGAIAVAVATLIMMGPAAAPVAAVSAPAAVAILGVSATVSAVWIAVAGGGVSTLGRLRQYRLEQRTDGRVVLERD